MLQGKLRCVNIAYVVCSLVFWVLSPSHSAFIVNNPPMNSFLTKPTLTNHWLVFATSGSYIETQELCICTERIQVLLTQWNRDKHRDEDLRVRGKHTWPDKDWCICLLPMLSSGKMSVNFTVGPKNSLFSGIVLLILHQYIVPLQQLCPKEIQCIPLCNATRPSKHSEKWKRSNF